MTFLPLFPFFVVGTMWFWLLIFCWFCAMVYAIEKDNGMKWPTVTLALMIAVMLVFGTGIADLLHWIRQNPLMTGVYAIGYFIVGAVYAGSPSVSGIGSSTTFWNATVNARPTGWVIGNIIATN